MARLRRLVLVRHAKSDYPWGVADHARPLNERGRRDAPAAGRWLGQNVPLDAHDLPLVLVSTARRAQLTWSLASAELPASWRAAEQRDEPRIYEAPAALLASLVRDAPETAGVVMVIGHNPGLVDLIESVALPGEKASEALVKFPTSAVAVLEVPAPWAAFGEVPVEVTAFAVPRGRPA